MNRFFLLLLLLPVNVVGQFNESFSDHDFFNNPTWQGCTDRFIVNDDQMLQLNAPAEKGEAWLFTKCEVVEKAIWQFRLKMKFNPSSSNFSRIYLVADQADPNAITNALYVEVGGTSDDVCLYRLADGVKERIIDGRDDRVDLSTVDLRVRVSRNDNYWNLEVDTGSGWVSEGVREFSGILRSSYFGLYCKYTSTRSSKFYFDDIAVSGEAYQDQDAPMVSAFSLMNGAHLQVTFDEKMELKTITPAQFILQQHNQRPETVVLQDDSISLDLFFNPGLNDVTDEELLITGLSDLAGNIIKDTTLVFCYERIRVEKIQMVNDSVVSVDLNKETLLSGWNNAVVDLEPGNYTTQIVEGEEPDRYLIQLKPLLTEAVAHTITLSGVQDDRGDTIRTVQKQLWYYHPRRFDIVINELMADPTPSMGLPESEYLELYNRTAYDLDLTDWYLEVNDKNYSLPDLHLATQVCVVLVPANKSEEWIGYDQVVAMKKWPALTNERVKVVLRDEKNRVVDAFYYRRDNIPGEPFKWEGGWSCERIDVNNLSGLNSNWSWSGNLNGGTPGSGNSNVMDLPDDEVPEIDYVTMDNDSVLTVCFSETMRLMNGNNSITFSTSTPEWEVASVDTIFLKQMEVRFSTALKKDVIHGLTHCGLTDWAGHVLELDEPVLFGATTEPTAGDVVINEVLFNPRPDEVDFVELHNRSDKIINLSHLGLAKMDENNEVVQLYPITSQSRLFLPGSFGVLTPDSTILKEAYKCKEPKVLLSMHDFPSLPDDEGQVIVTNLSGAVLDSFSYSDKMHFDLLKDREGVSLERLSVDLPAYDEHNWHSAASTAGYATPTYANSQTLPTSSGEDVVVIEPEVFSPDGDGNDDQLLIKVNSQEPEGTIFIRIFNAMGQEVCYLANNQTLATNSFFTWDGLSEERQQLRPGIYVVWIRCVYASGKVTEQKRTCVLSHGESVN